MLKSPRSRSKKKPGQAPGTLTYVGESRSDQVTIRRIAYNRDSHKDAVSISMESALAPRESGTITWIDVEGLTDINIIDKIGEAYGLHSLVREDILNTTKRPKFEDYENYIYIVLRMIYQNHKDQQISEQLSLILGPDWVLTFQEVPGDIFTPVRERIKQGKGKIRFSGADYLAYALVDAVVDNYFSVIERLGERLEALEDSVVQAPDAGTLKAIHTAKRDMLFMRRAVWPMREVIGGLLRDDSELVQAGTRIYLRDVYDHAVEVIEVVEMYRDMVSSLLEVYLSSINNRMNAVIKVLTIIATIFMPLTFIVGLYGMNFKHMPELDWQYGYPLCLALMAAVTVGMIVFFRRKEWI